MVGRRWELMRGEKQEGNRWEAGWENAGGGRGEGWEVVGRRWELMRDEKQEGNRWDVMPVTGALSNHAFRSIDW